MTPRVRAVLEQRWESLWNAAEGWIWPAPTKTGHIDHSTLKKQHQGSETVRRAPFRALQSSSHIRYAIRRTGVMRGPCADRGHSLSLSVAMTYIHPSKIAVLMPCLAWVGTILGTTEIAACSPRSRMRAATAAGLSRWVVSAEGLEPSTHALKGHCSTS